MKRYECHCNCICRINIYIYIVIETKKHIKGICKLTFHIYHNHNKMRNNNSWSSVSVLEVIMFYVLCILCVYELNSNLLKTKRESLKSFSSMMFLSQLNLFCFKKGKWNRERESMEPVQKPNSTLSVCSCANPWDVLNSFIQMHNTPMLNSIKVDRYLLTKLH